MWKFNSSNTFCISLINKEYRWNKMVEKFDKIKLNVTRWNASTPDNIIDNFDNSLNKFQKACAQSHVNIWKYIVHNNLEYAFIIEDDACFDKDYFSKLEELYTKNLLLNNNWGAIFLNSSEPLSDIFTWSKANEQYLAGGYILSQKGANTLLRIFNECYYSSDWMTSRLQYYESCFTYFPWLIIQEGKESTIGSNYQADHDKVIRCLDSVKYSLSNYI